ncbi:MAG: hypothetical protein JSU98_11740 [Gemmatimonadales bacterium]|jgi:hypothetical protein|nr:MAG: hypothetical protein JSU98_11740 [Gemmatimonadales bacterium]
MASTQAAAEYGAVVAQSAATKVQIIADQASRWVGDHPGLVGVGVGLLVLVIWASRPRVG